ncbi:MAG: amino acid ABC transporter substrate-binding protein [Alphaproteobacteria bacterium]|nr:amino acid ABC transporter substrate-binding protein [Alphaproteobacteria bacterium]
MNRNTTAPALLLSRRTLAGAMALALVLLASGAARAAEPITIGFGMALTGGLAAIGKSALLAMQIWEKDINAKGGLLGRPVKLVYYDDQSNPPTVPGLYTKLIDVDKVDIVVSGYATNMIAPAMPVIIQHDRLFLGLFGLAVNTEFHYPKYFSMLPAGPDPKHAFAQPFFDVALAGDPKPKTLAIVAADAEYPKNASEGARDIAKSAGLQIVYDKSYPPSTTDYTPIVRAVQATSPDMVFVASYPPDSVGMVRAINETGFKTRYIGGGMVGLQITSIKQQLGPAINGIIDYDWWIPSPALQFPGVMDFLKTYQEQAASAGVDPLGWYLPPFAYANMQVLAQAIEGAKTLDQGKLADYIRGNSFKTIVGDIAYGTDGEWSKPRVLEVQFQGIKGNSLDQFKDIKTEAILEPIEYRTGQVIAPYSAGQK